LGVSRRTLMRDRRCSLRANSEIGCGNECARDWLVACHGRAVWFVGAFAMGARLGEAFLVHISAIQNHHLG